MCKFKKGFLKSIVGLLCLSSLSSFAQSNPMNVLFIGNSYTHMNEMPKLFEQIAVSKKIKINVEMSAKSNHTFKMHCNRPEMFETIKSKKWDYVVIQGFSRELSHDYQTIDTASIPYFNRIVDSVYANNPCTNVLLYMTWGYEDGCKSCYDDDTFLKMSDRIKNGYQYLSNIYNLPIVPVGDVYKYVRENHPTIDLYREDKQHPTLNGSYLIASTFYSAIFKSSPINSFVSTLTPTIAETLQRSAYNVVNNSLDVYKLRNNTLDVSYEQTKAGYFAYCKAFYPNATSLKWDFGDGTGSTDRNVVHKYKKYGTYNVKLIVEDACGVREINRKVTFKAPKAPEKKKSSQPKTTSNNKKKI
jgi:hypothetical protein